MVETLDVLDEVLRMKGVVGGQAFYVTGMDPLYVLVCML